MNDTASYMLVIHWRDGEREIAADHASLQAAAADAFGLADQLSLPGCPRAAAEVAILRGAELQLSITIIPGQPLRKFGR